MRFNALRQFGSGVSWFFYSHLSSYKKSTLGCRPPDGSHQVGHRSIPSALFGTSTRQDFYLSDVQSILFLYCIWNPKPSILYISTPLLKLIFSCHDFGQIMVFFLCTFSLTLTLLLDDLFYLMSWFGPLSYLLTSTLYCCIAYIIRNTSSSCIRLSANVSMWMYVEKIIVKKV